MLRQSLASVTSHALKSDILTPWKDQERRRREVYVASGTPDPAIRRGMFRRTMNPVQTHLNSREGIAPPQRGVNIAGSLGSHVHDYPSGDFPEHLLR